MAAVLAFVSAQTFNTTSGNSCGGNCPGIFIDTDFAFFLFIEFFRWLWLLPLWNYHPGFGYCRLVRQIQWLEPGNFLKMYECKLDVTLISPQAHCQCIVKHESGGNAHAVNQNSQGGSYKWDVGLWWDKIKLNLILDCNSFYHRQVNSFNWASCSGGNAPCDASTNLACGKIILLFIFIFLIFIFNSHQGVQLGRQHLEELVHLRRLRCLRLQLSSRITRG